MLLDSHQFPFPFQPQKSELSLLRHYSCRRRLTTQYF
nr:MAG TPA: hypothetical protein [Caudoviricetes sp.]DAV59995.1 MAG TPA: hypothetical protein [Caudoviricetes sp.]